MKFTVFGVGTSELGLSCAGPGFKGLFFLLSPRVFCYPQPTTRLVEGCLDTCTGHIQTKTTPPLQCYPILAEPSQVSIATPNSSKRAVLFDKFAAPSQPQRSNTNI